MAGMIKWSRKQPPRSRAQPVKQFRRTVPAGTTRAFAKVATFQRKTPPPQQKVFRGFPQRPQPVNPTVSKIALAQAPTITLIPDSPWTEALEPRAIATVERMRRYLNSLAWKPNKSRPLRLVYLSCHGPLEHDELTLFGELDCEWICFAHTLMGELTRPRESVRTRSYPKGCVESLQKVASSIGPHAVPADLLNWADALVIMYEPSWLTHYIGRFGSKPIIYRTIGQSLPEAALRNVRNRVFVVRMSPRESVIPGYMGADVVIRFAKDPAEFSGWTGIDPTAISVMGMPNLRRASSRIDLLENTLRQIPNSELFGLYTEHDVPGLGKGTIPYKHLKERMRQARLYFTVGSVPGPYTMSLIEAMMTGCPIATLGPALWSQFQPQTRPLYETPDILNDCGIVSDEPQNLLREIRDVIGNWDRARILSEKTRARALQLFGKETASRLWGSIFDTMRSHR
jgi:hypothetical protein